MRLPKEKQWKKFLENREDILKTLIFNGSPRKNGNTVSVLNLLKEELNGEVIIINAYYDNIKPCVDCRYCWDNPGCIIEDDMQKVYKYIEEADNIVIASPLYFSELTGRTLDVLSRLQTYFTAKTFRNETPLKKPKRGGVILMGGGDGSMEKAFGTAICLLKHMNVKSIYPMISCHNADDIEVSKDESIQSEIKKIVEFFHKKI